MRPATTGTDPGQPPRQGRRIQLDVTVGETGRLVVTADDNVLPLVRTDVAGDRLKIYIDSSLSTSIGVQVTASTPELKALVGSGASKVSAIGITGQRCKIELDGASHGELSSDSDVMDITLSGASRALLTGACNQLTAECSGASHLNAADFIAAKVTANVNGASSAQVNAKEELTAAASGASNIRYTGQPAKLNKQASGASTVSPR